METLETQVPQSTPIQTDREKLFEMNKELSPAMDIPIEEEDDFSYHGYEVVRGQYFAHTNEPCITFNKSRVMINAACIRKLPNVTYVQLLVNEEEKRILVKPCEEYEKDSFMWCTAKRKSRQVKCEIPFVMIYNMMHWNPKWRYKMVGKLIVSGGEPIFLFDLNDAESYVTIVREDGTTATSRKPTYPKEWQNTFGLPVEEHDNIMKINVFNGYAVIDLEGEKKDGTDNAADTAGHDDNANTGTEGSAGNQPGYEEEQNRNT